MKRCSISCEFPLASAYINSCRQETILTIHTIDTVSKKTVFLLKTSRASVSLPIVWTFSSFLTKIMLTNCSVKENSVGIQLFQPLDNFLKQTSYTNIIYIISKFFLQTITLNLGNGPLGSFYLNETS